MTAVFLQVRLDSSRLPRKALLDLAGKTVVEHAMNALSLVKSDIRMLLTTEDSENELRPLAAECGWDVFVGPKDDVLARFVLAARETGASVIIRATGDNPLVSPAMANAAVKISESSGAAYSGIRGIPVGAGVEIIRVRRLEEAYAEASDPYEREHVAPFLYRRPERFHIEIQDAPSVYSFPEGRITLDTPDDYTFLNGLFQELYSGAPLELDQVIPYLKRRS